jgi:hypothetical protein
MADDDWVDMPEVVSEEYFESLLYSDHGDPHAQALFDEFIFNADLSESQRASAYDELCDYLWDVYGINFEESFDWADFREWYDAA